VYTESLRLSAAPVEARISSAPPARTAGFAFNESVRVVEEESSALSEVELDLLIAQLEEEAQRPQ
jgi:hypothetical protein